MSCWVNAITEDAWNTAHDTEDKKRKDTGIIVS
jgi:hypothetical protein